MNGSTAGEGEESTCGGIARVQELQEVEEGGVVYRVQLKRTRYHSLGPEDPAHLSYETTKVRVVKAGRLEELVGCLAPAQGTVDPLFLNCFLCTYQTFTTPEGLVEQLLQRYSSAASEEGGASEGALVGDGASEGTLVQKSVISFCRLWMDQHSDDFNQPPHFPALTKLTMFMEENVAQDQECFSLAKKLKTGFESQHKQSLLLSADSPKAYPSFGIFSLSPQHLAEQLTSIAAVLFRAVKCHECVKFPSARSDKDKAANAPSVWATVEQFNRLSRVTVATILQATSHDSVTREHTAHARARVVGQWLQVALHCRKLKNFSSLKAVLSGLDSQPIHRLKRTWSCLSSDQVSAFDELLLLMATDNNHEMSRNVLQREGTAKHSDATLSEERQKGGAKSRTCPSLSMFGVVPYLGTFLQDLTFIDSAHPNTIKGDLINFDKRRKYFELFAQLQLFQMSAALYPASYAPHPGLQYWLRHTPVYTDKESYDFSLVLEPEGGVEGTDVSSSRQPFATHSSLRKKLRSLLSSKTVVDLSHTPTSGGVGETLQRHYSSSGHFQGENEEDPIIKVSIQQTQDLCNYKCIKLKKTMSGSALISLAQEKHCLQGGNPSDFALYQVLSDKRKLPIPLNSPVFFAMKCSGEDEYNFVLEPKTSQ